MTETPFADRLDALARRVLGGPASSPVRLTGGASLELWSFDAGGAGYVLRRQAGASHFSEMARIDLAVEAAVVSAAGDAGVPAARVAHVLAPEDGLGSGFIASREPGEALGRRIVADPAFAAIRPRLAARCGEVLALIHAVPLGRLPELPARTPAETLDRIADQLAAYGEPRPVFEGAIAWLRARCPAPVAPRLVHGDFRNGNFLLTPDRLSAVLDWEGAHLGDPLEDLGWLIMPVWRFGRLDLPVGGFGERRALFDAYAGTSGRPVDAGRVRWWEIHGMLRWGLTCMAMAHAFLGGDTGIERGAVGRRASEAELELLVAITGRRLMEDRPDSAALLDAVGALLRDAIVPALDGAVAYHARIAASLVAIVARQRRQGEDADAAELERLRALLGGEGDLGPLNVVLAARLRGGAIGLDDPAIADHLWRTTLAKLAIDQPRYPRLKQLEDGGDRDG